MELLTKKNHDYLIRVDQMDESEILPDVPRILKYLSSQDVPIALGSASKNARTILHKVNLFHFLMPLLMELMLARLSQILKSF